MSKRPGIGAQGSLKDGSSTDVVVHAGKIISTFWQCGDGYQLDPYTLNQSGTVSWAPIDGISAHPKVDENTGEMLFFNYSRYPPYQHYGVINRVGKLVHYTPVPLPGPRLPHDMAFSKNYSIFADLPLFWDPKLLEDNIYFPCYYPELPTRFSIIPRFGTEKDIVQFEAKPTYVLHWLNAYEGVMKLFWKDIFRKTPIRPPPWLVERRWQTDGSAGSEPSSAEAVSLAI